MLRWTRRILTAISALLLVVVLAGWVDGKRAATRISIRPRDVVAFFVDNRDGRCIIGLTSYDRRWPEVKATRTPPIRYWQLKDALFHVETRNGQSFLVVTHRILALVFALVPAKSFLVWQRKRRRDRVGKCASCGYDLRGGDGPCPECGASRGER